MNALSLSADAPRAAAPDAVTGTVGALDVTSDATITPAALATDSVAASATIALTFDEESDSEAAASVPAPAKRVEVAALVEDEEDGSDDEIMNPFVFAASDDDEDEVKDAEEKEDGAAGVGSEKSAATTVESTLVFDDESSSESDEDGDESALAAALPSAAATAASEAAALATVNSLAAVGLAAPGAAAAINEEMLLARQYMEEEIEETNADRAATGMRAIGATVASKRATKKQIAASKAVTHVRMGLLEKLALRRAQLAAGGGAEEKEACVAGVEHGGGYEEEEESDSADSASDSASDSDEAEDDDDDELVFVDADQPEDASIAAEPAAPAATASGVTAPTAVAPLSRTSSGAFKSRAALRRNLMNKSLKSNALTRADGVRQWAQMQSQAKVLAVERARIAGVAVQAATAAMAAACASATTCDASCALAVIVASAEAARLVAADAAARAVRAALPAELADATDAAARIPTADESQAMWASDGTALVAEQITIGPSSAAAVEDEVAARGVSGVDAGDDGVDAGDDLIDQLWDGDGADGADDALLAAAAPAVVRPAIAAPAAAATAPSEVDEFGDDFGDDFGGDFEMTQEMFDAADSATLAYEHADTATLAYTPASQTESQIEKDAAEPATLVAELPVVVPAIDAAPPASDQQHAPVLRTYERKKMAPTATATSSKMQLNRDGTMSAAPMQKGIGSFFGSGASGAAAAAATSCTPAPKPRPSGGALASMFSKQAAAGGSKRSRDATAATGEECSADAVDPKRQRHALVAADASEEPQPEVADEEEQEEEGEEDDREMSHHFAMLMQDDMALTEKMVGRMEGRDKVRGAFHVAELLDVDAEDDGDEKGDAEESAPVEESEEGKGGISEGLFDEEDYIDDEDERALEAAALREAADAESESDDDGDVAAAAEANDEATAVAKGEEDGADAAADAATVKAASSKKSKRRRGAAEDAPGESSDEDEEGRMQAEWHRARAERNRKGDARPASCPTFGALQRQDSFLADSESQSIMHLLDHGRSSSSRMTFAPLNVETSSNGEHSHNASTTPLLSSSSRSAPFASVDAERSVSRSSFGALARSRSFAAKIGSSVQGGAAAGSGATSFSSFNAGLKNAKQRGGATSRRFVFTASESGDRFAKSDDRFAKVAGTARVVQKVRAVLKKSTKSPSAGGNRKAGGLLGLVTRNNFGSSKGQKKRKAASAAASMRRPKLARGRTA